MADPSSVSSVAESCKKPSSIPKLLTSFTSLKTLSDTFENAVMSPTSILDNIPFCTIKNTLWPEQTPITSHESENTKKLWDKNIGLGLVDVLTNDLSGSNSQITEDKKMVFFGTKMKVYVPPLPLSHNPQPHCPVPFDTQPESLPPVKEANISSSVTLPVPLTAREMELSEDYTCVISHVGPTPTATHIFDNYILDRVCFPTTNDAALSHNASIYSPNSFLSYCYTCKKNIDDGQDIYIYRGEMAFCSMECRDQEILFEEGSSKAEEDGA